MVIDTLRDPSRGVELQQLVVRLERPLALDRLRLAFAAAQARFEVLRSAFRWEGEGTEEGMLQEVYRACPLPLERQVLEGGHALARFLAADRARGFDAARPPLHRVTLLAGPALEGTALEGPASAATEGDAFVWTFHHAILDGRSYRRVLEEVLDHLDGVAPAATPTPSFGDYCRAIDAIDHAPSLAYFARLLEGASATPTPTSETGSVRRHAETTLRMADIRGALAGAEATGVSIANLVQAAWAWVLARRARTDDVLFGTTRSGRLPSIADVSEVVGCLVDTLPLRIRVDQREPASTLLRHVRAEGLALRAHEHTPLTQTLGAAGVSLSSLVVVERYDLDTAMRERGGRNAERHFALHEQSDFALLLAAYQDGTSLRLVLEHDEGALGREDATLLLEHVAAAIEALGRAAREGDTTPLAALPVFAPGEEARLRAWALGPRAAIEDDGTSVVERFVGLTRGTPDQLGVRDAQGVEMSRRELLERARRIAGAITTAGVLPHDVVFVLLPRSIQWVAALWGCWLADCVYVPLDPSSPAERLQLVHDDVLESGLGRRPVVVHDAASRELARRALPRATLIDVDAAWDHALRASSTSPQEAELGAGRAEPLAYLLYTSGTTGRPKGTRVTHRALAAHASAAIEAFGLGPTDRALQFTALGFDVSIEEVVPTLLAGGRVVLRSEQGTHDLDLFVREVAQTGITLLNLPSAFAHELLAHLELRGGELPRSVRCLVVGGERPPPEIWARLSALNTRAVAQGHAPVRLLNGYGPTEVTITSVLCDVAAAGVPPSARELPIGRAFGACRAHVVRVLEGPSRVRSEVDRGSLPPPPVRSASTVALTSIEEPGELWLSGPQVASGYLARPEATEAAFVPDPFAGEDTRHRLAYRTGDLVKVTRTGELVFLGRIDRQLKLRGHRIEPREIERTILAHHGVLDAVVVLAGEAEARALVGFVTLEVPLDLTIVRDGLAKRLPSVMVPSMLLALEELPRSTSGKIDRTALTARATEALRQRGNSAAREEPRNDVEAWLRPLFADVLGRDDVALEHSFFEMGGHSLLAIRLLGRLQAERPDLAISLAMLFAHPSVRALADALGAAQAAEAPTLVRLNPRRGDIEGELPLFCVCGVQLYGPLARAMEADRPVFGAFLPIEEEAFAHGTALDVPAMARDYVALVQRERPHGPYLLGGVSFGGMLAYEMAQLLTARGEEVRLVALFDTILPRGFESNGWRARAKTGLGGLRTYAERMLGGWGRRTGGVGRGVEDQDAGLRERALRDQALRAAAESYDRVIKPYVGRVVIFRARDGRGELGEAVRWDMGWTGLVRSDTPTLGVAGDHVGILREPGVAEIATALRTTLAR